MLSILQTRRLYTTALPSND
ncbi:hypothetical protein AZE42_13515 [Rhizopogon vesiculosus]|uniref:Uncharacterized protein n=1 Tax=Rhizopogon vesiculosus TaxID=180088 RepID=A0A1J8PSF2_9AGAM|nr:hypothetical protein AZE42_13515 [Rhizopogon vesiculosus]